MTGYDSITRASRPGSEFLRRLPEVFPQSFQPRDPALARSPGSFLAKAGLGSPALVPLHHNVRTSLTSASHEAKAVGG
jgi:hypothetical protein